MNRFDGRSGFGPFQDALSQEWNGGLPKQEILHQIELSPGAHRELLEVVAAGSGSVMVQPPLQVEFATGDRETYAALDVDAVAPNPFTGQGELIGRYSAVGQRSNRNLTLADEFVDVPVVATLSTVTTHRRDWWLFGRTSVSRTILNIMSATAPAEA